MFWNWFELEHKNHILKFSIILKASIKIFRNFASPLLNTATLGIGNRRKNVYTIGYRQL